MLEFVGPFLRSPFLPLQEVYFVQNTNVLSFELFFRLFIDPPPLPIPNIIFLWVSQVLNFDVWKKDDQVAQIGFRGGGGGAQWANFGGEAI